MQIDVFVQTHAAKQRFAHTTCPLSSEMKRGEGGIFLQQPYVLRPTRGPRGETGIQQV